jgi:cyclase
VGEILITSIDREGTLQEFDNDLFREIGNAVAVHLIFSGGAGSYDDMVGSLKRPIAMPVLSARCTF